MGAAQDTLEFAVNFQALATTGPTPVSDVDLYMRNTTVPQKIGPGHYQFVTASHFATHARQNAVRLNATLPTGQGTPVGIQFTDIPNTPDQGTLVDIFLGEFGAPDDTAYVHVAVDRLPLDPSPA